MYMHIYTQVHYACIYNSTSTRENILLTTPPYPSLLTPPPPSRSHPLQHTAWAAALLSRSFLCRSCFRRYSLPHISPPPPSPTFSPSQHTAWAAALLSRSFLCRSCFRRYLAFDLSSFPAILGCVYVTMFTVLKSYFPSLVMAPSAGTNGGRISPDLGTKVSWVVVGLPNFSTGGT